MRPIPTLSPLTAVSFVTVVVMLAGCGPLSPHAERVTIHVDDHPAICPGTGGPDTAPGSLCLRVSEDGDSWVAVDEINGFKREWGIDSKIVVVTRDPAPQDDHSRHIHEHKKTLDRSDVDPGTEFTIGGRQTGLTRDGAPFELTGPTGGVFDDGKPFTCADESVCDRLDSILDNPESAVELTLSYQSDVHGPLMLENVRQIDR